VAMDGQEACLQTREWCDGLLEACLRASVNKAGEAFLERYHEMTRLLREHQRGVCSIEIDVWNRRRDKVLDAVEGKSK